jgi:hypothetical protein
MDKYKILQNNKSLLIIKVNKILIFNLNLEYHEKLDWLKELEINSIRDVDLLKMIIFCFNYDIKSQSSVEEYFSK